MIDYLKVADRSWPVLGPLFRGHAALYKATGGRLGGRLPGLPPMLLIDHVGARTHKKRTTPLVYMPDGEDFVVVAAKGGYPEHPSWVHNLRADPDAEIRIGSDRIKVRASEANAEERRRLWPRAVAYNPWWGRYQRRTGRTIPVVIMERRSG